MKCKLSTLWNWIHNQLWISNPRKESYYILKNFFSLSEKDFIIDTQVEVSLKKLKTLKDIIRRRNLHEPFAYIFQKKEFFSLNFKVTPDVLIPRPETEELVELALKEINKISFEHLLGMDIGTGSGCIAISLLKNCPKIQTIYAIDREPKTLVIARENAILLLKEKANQIRFLVWDILQKNLLFENFFHFLIANPPYILVHEHEKLQKEIFFEPYEALVVEKPTYFFYRFFKNAFLLLKSNGYFFLESSPSLIPLQKKILKRIGFSTVFVYKDYNHLERFLVTRKP
ncbi:MAG: HemK/PrmC family methyltransferase [Leptonema sp. (in: bacteria)]